MTLKIQYAVLVYQGPIANVFSVASIRGVDQFGRYGGLLRTKLQPDRTLGRLLRGSFRECEAFARGLQAAGVYVQSAACNEAGDIADRPWCSDLRRAAPWSASFRPVFSAPKTRECYETHEGNCYCPVNSTSGV